MEINPNQQEYIDRYLRGELQGQELDEFLALIKNDPAMASALKIQDTMAQGIEYQGNQELKKHLQQLSSEVRTSKTTSKAAPKRNLRIIRIIAIGAAAAIALFIVSTFISQQVDTQQLFADYYQPSALSITRQTDIEAQIAQAENLYAQGDYASAIPVLRNLLNQQPQNAAIQLALGNAFLNSQQPEQAISEFQSIIDRNAPLYTDQAKWYLALTHLKLDDIAACKNLLQQLTADPDADFHQQALDLLKDL